MIEIRFEIGGRKVDPNELSDALEAAVLEAVERQIRAKVGSIRHPETGEFPVVMVRGRSLEDLSVEVTGSNELISLISERLDGPTQRPNELPSGNGKVVRSATSDMVVHMENPHPRAFLCHATENKVLAERIAHDLQAAGIETFYARVGDEGG